MNKGRWAIALIVVLVGIMLTSGVAAAITPSTMSIEPDSQVVGIGDAFQVDVYVDPAEPIAAGQVDLGFDSAVLQATTVTEGTFLSQSGQSIYFNLGSIDNVAGTVSDIYGVIAAPAIAVSTPAAFATITFTAITEGTAAVTITDALLGNLQAEAVPLTIVGGTVTVYPDWDVDLDGHQNVLDMVSIYQHFMETGAIHWLREDVNRDGTVNVLDMILVGQHWTG